MKSVYAVNSNSISLSAENIVPGIYFVKIKSSSGEKKVIRIIKK